MSKQDGSEPPRVQRHPETREVIWVEAQPVKRLLERLIDTQSTTRIETWGQLYEDASALLAALQEEKP